MKKREVARTSDGMRREYDLRGGIRGKYSGRFVKHANVVVLAPDVSAVFPDSESVNDALRTLIHVARARTRSSPRSRKAAAGRR
jgi:hypothetical protein